MNGTPPVRPKKNNANVGALKHLSALGDLRLTPFGQLHSSLNGGSLEQGRIDRLTEPALPLDADTPRDAVAQLDVDTPGDPHPLVFGPVVTLQNVAVISSMQKTPVGAGTVGVDWTAGAPNCCTLDDVTSCAAAGDATKRSAEINVRMWPISMRVNKPENDDPSIVEPIPLAGSAA